jgi:glycerol dehydrogenase
MQVFGACNRYVQGYGALGELRQYTGYMGKTFFIMASKNRLRALEGTVREAMGSGLELVFFEFGGECSWEEIRKAEKTAKAAGADAVFGIGGGKAADAAKVVAHLLQKPVVIIPTIAASDASTSAASLIYNAEGTVEEVLNFPRSPELVLVDTRVLIESPVRLFVAGMGDALSTYIGAKVCQEHFVDNHFGGKGTQTALAIAKLSYDTLLSLGRQAKAAADARAVTDAYNRIVEVNILMSGLGFENNGSASDHSFYFGALALPGRAEYVFHGEGVAFSTCCQMVMQGASDAELDEVYSFCLDVGLPITLGDMRLTDLTEDEYVLMTEETLRQQFVSAHPFEVTFEKVYGAYKTADTIGHMYKKGGRLR